VAPIVGSGLVAVAFGYGQLYRNISVITFFVGAALIPIGLTCGVSALIAATSFERRRIMKQTAVGLVIGAWLIWQGVHAFTTWRID
jgi:hypothetical protein